MASADMRGELTCSICLNIYTDPVTLQCGHNFCQACIRNVLDSQVTSGVYTCPDCRSEFKECPTLQRNTTLCNIGKSFLSTHPEQDTSAILCTNCLHVPVPAVKTCLLCEAALCSNHVKVHTKSPEHVLIEPSISLETWKCAVHNEILKFYCTVDAACVCVSCILFGAHIGHQIEPLSKASDKKKEDLKTIMQTLTSRTEKIDTRVKKLNEYKEKTQEKATSVTERVAAIIRDIKKQLDDLQNQVFCEIYGQNEVASAQIAALIHELDTEKEALSKKMCHIEELCNMTNPLCFLREWSSSSPEFCDIVKGTVGDTNVPNVMNLDEDKVLMLVQTGIDEIVTEVKMKLDVNESSEVLLDVTTAGNNVALSHDDEIVTGTCALPRVESRSAVTVKWGGGGGEPVPPQPQRPACTPSPGPALEPPTNPDRETQKAELREMLKAPQKKGDELYVIDSRWFKQWKKYVGYDSWDMYNVGECNPGPVNNSGLFSDADTLALKEHLIDELDYVLVPNEAWLKLMSWYGSVEGQQPIVRKVVEFGMFVKQCKVEVYLIELKLCNESNPDTLIPRHFSKADTIETIEKEMRNIFRIPVGKETRLWKRYMKNTYEQLTKPEDTVEDAGLYQGEVVVIEQRNADGTWPRQSNSQKSHLKSLMKTMNGGQRNHKNTN
ncbi:E3 ubiquitin- ligase TRIM39-like [Pelobates cultripes]|uniref:ubiquitinyl hydrolase 1 n=1 Tax=Pelobates cultripes TaxID=61616 RepID=A0AAD1W3D0_PELCU|nr:E3 ubiquitin- ligase TRIM39-like [Pelobates cultripes]